ncbi:MAG: hypothetical protein J5546_08310, partial [Lachnospiraceae bacterium]|nr:hypothetical protein [Lachnospiraceae bacterium]
MRRSLAWIMMLAMLLVMGACTNQSGDADASQELSTEVSTEASTSEVSSEAVPTETGTIETGTLEPPLDVVSEGPADVLVLFTSDVHCGIDQ